MPPACESATNERLSSLPAESLWPRFRTFCYVPTPVRTASERTAKDRDMLGAHLTPGEYLDRCAAELGKLDTGVIEAMGREIYEAWEDGRFVFICGNGGSGSNSSHLCEDLGKSTLDRKDFTNDAMKRLKVLSLTDNTPYILAWGNDEGFDRVFVEQLKNFASPDDVLIAISGSGNSANILRAVEWANAKRLRTWGITGYTGGTLAKIAHHNLHVPLDDMGMVESIHLTAFHWVLNDVYARINRVGRYAAMPIRRAA
jgi:D-sedoheptulose 7-phosphate isomerase